VGWYNEVFDLVFNELDLNKPIRARFRIPRRKTTSQKTMTKDNCHQKNNNNNKRTSKIRENTSDLDRQTSINAA
jgi:hypothetical protein